MQALSQLSYGPTMLEAEFYAAVKRSPSLFSETPKKECTQPLDHRCRRFPAVRIDTQTKENRSHVPCH